ncbi:hypothetical protein [Billgrantia desiderata]|uniref:hypothetical protein n=1 Tax=Billgrantia desiderata TaxID=52021 RepID=UPI001C3D4D70|nr:hypothetical protein [Halomonas desiderata]
MHEEAPPEPFGGDEKLDGGIAQVEQGRKEGNVANLQHLAFEAPGSESLPYLGGRLVQWIECIYQASRDTHLSPSCR